MTAKRFGLFGTRTRDFLTYGGRILVHHDAAQLKFLVPTHPARELPPDIPDDQTMPIRFHPELGAVQWTKDGDIAGREQFRDPNG
ncbi:hypothetical protein [Saccharothrix xinjiangensis]|uniref:Uncharacterized protein n=1 Tax=Saccharothrix xinjiangensis TaxID=204798 RepID=A0ABV9XTF3_9PSEU